MPRYKLSLRTKIVATIIGVTLIVVVGGAWKAAEQVRAAEKGGDLERSIKRQVDLLSQLGSGDYAVTRLIAADPSVNTALSNGDAAAALGLEKSAASKRYTRALERLKQILATLPGGEISEEGS